MGLDEGLSRSISLPHSLSTTDVETYHLFTTPKTHTVPFIACYYKPSLRQAQSLLYLCLHRSVVKLLPDACTGGTEGGRGFFSSFFRPKPEGRQRASERAMERRGGHRQRRRSACTYLWLRSSVRRSYLMSDEQSATSTVLGHM